MPRSARTSADWRDRLRWRRAADKTAAEAAIRRAYGAAGLGEPEHILWAGGPTEAAEAIDFLRHPPVVLRRFVLVLAVFGGLLWCALALAFSDERMALWPSSHVVFTIGLAAGGLMVAATRPLPQLRRIAEPASPVPAATLGVLAAVAPAGYLYVLFHVGGLPATPARAAALVLAAALGTLPGLFLRSRIHRHYRRLSPGLRKLPRQKPVARRFIYAQARASRFVDLGADIQPDDTLIDVYNAAYRQVLQGPPTLYALQAAAGSELGPGPASAATLWGMLSPTALPVHWDGLEQATWAGAVDLAGMEGPEAAFADLAFHVDRLYPYEAIAIAVHMPSAVRLDADGRPHGEDGPALTWPDCTSICAWRGHVVPPELVDPALTLNLARIRRESTAERRGVLIERYGLGRYLLDSGAREISRDSCGRLYHLAQPWDEPIVAVRVVNSTAEPDGTRQEFWLRVPPTAATAREGVAWTFGLDEEQYAPAFES